MDAGAILQRNPQYVVRPISREGVAVPTGDAVNDGYLYSLNGTALFVAERLDGRTPLGAIASELHAACEPDGRPDLDSMTADVVAWAEGFVEEGLAEVVSAPVHEGETR